MPESVRFFFEAQLGRDLSDVRVHTDAVAAASARSLNAQAYAVGDHIVFDDGRYSPHTHQGTHLLAHELVHVVQQRDGPERVQRQEVEEREFQRPERFSVKRRVDGDLQIWEVWKTDDNLATYERRALGKYLRWRFGTLSSGLRKKLLKILLDAPSEQKTISPEPGLYYSLIVSRPLEKEVVAEFRKRAGGGVEVGVREADVPDEQAPRREKGAGGPEEGRRRGDMERKEKKAGGEPGREREESGIGADPQLTPEEREAVEGLSEVIKGGKAEESVDPKELIRLYQVLRESVKDPRFTEEGGRSWVRFARFLEENREQIEGILHGSPKGELTQEQIQEIILHYEKYVAAEPVEEETGELETLEDFEKEFRYDPGWQRLSKEDRRLILQYARMRPEDMTEGSVDFKRLSTRAKMIMALRLSDKSALGEMASAAERAFSDPTFLVTLIAILGVYVGLWLTPDPSMITKVAAGTLTVVLLAQFAWHDIYGLAKAWFALEEACEKAKTVEELRAAGDRFLTAIGPIGFDILLFIVLWRVGKRVGPKLRKTGAKRARVRAEKSLAEAEARPGSGKTPKTTAETAGLLAEAKTAAGEGATPTAILDALSGRLPESARAGLKQFRTDLPGDAQVLKAIESTSGKGLDITHFLAEKGMSAEAVRSVRADVVEAHARYARARLIEIDAIKDPHLRSTARAELVQSVRVRLAKLGILRDPKVQRMAEVGTRSELVSALGEAIGRAQLRAKYGEGHQVLGNVEIVRKVEGFRSIQEWTAAERAAGRSGDPGGLYEWRGKLWKSVTEIDALVGKRRPGGKLKPVEIEQTKTGARDTATAAEAQGRKALGALRSMGGGEKGVRIVERSGKNELGKDLTESFDLSELGQVSLTTRGLPRKTGFTMDVLFPEEVLKAVAESLRGGGMPRAEPRTIPPQVSPRKEEVRSTPTR